MITRSCKMKRNVEARSELSFCAVYILPRDKSNRGRVLRKEKRKKEQKKEEPTRSWVSRYEKQWNREDFLDGSSDWVRGSLRKAVAFQTSQGTWKNTRRFRRISFNETVARLLDKFPQCTPDTCAITVLFKSIETMTLT